MFLAKNKEPSSISVCASYDVEVVVGDRAGYRHCWCHNWIPRSNSCNFISNRKAWVDSFLFFGAFCIFKYICSRLWMHWYLCVWDSDIKRTFNEAFRSTPCLRLLYIHVLSNHQLSPFIFAFLIFLVKVKKFLLFGWGILNRHLSSLLIL